MKINLGYKNFNQNLILTCDIYIENFIIFLV